MPLSSGNIAPAADSRITIPEAAEAFLAKCRYRGIAEPTFKKYRTFVKQLRAYCDGRGYICLDQLTVTDMDRFYASWNDGKRSRAKKLERLKAFIKFCQKRDWLQKNIAEDLEAPEGSSIPAAKAPFTDEELRRIYTACDALGGPTAPGPGYRDWSGEDVKDFIMLSIYTGLRISDVATFDITARLKGNDVFLRMHKTRKELYTWIPDRLVNRLREREKRYGALIFRTGQSTVMRTMAELWRVKLGTVFAVAGPFDEPPTPHRFRQTFVRILLQKGVPVVDVAELIGDTEQILRRHYAKWVPERQARLSKILKEAFDDKPTLVPAPRQECDHQTFFGIVQKSKTEWQETLLCALSEQRRPLRLSRIQQGRMYPAGGGFGNAVNGVGLLPSHPDLDHARIVFHQLSHSLPA